MKCSILFLLLGCLLVGIQGEKSQPDFQTGVNEQIFGLIEVAVKVAQYTRMEEKQKALGWVQSRVDNIKEMLDTEPAPVGTEEPAPEPEPETVYYEDCMALNDAGFTNSSLYDIYPEFPANMDPMSVYCDQETDGGGWIVFQRRTDGSQPFEKTWEEYREGFGDKNNEFWLGNDDLVVLTKPKASATSVGGNVVLRVDITDWADNTAFAKYSDFAVNGPLYTLTADGYEEESTAGDALDYHNGMAFTTIDYDNDMASGGNCAEWMRGGWWFNYCLQADPNGPYLFPGGQYGAYTPGTDQGVTWTTYTAHGYSGREYSLKGTEMKLRRAPEIST